MEVVGILIFGLYGLGILISIAIIIFLIAKRIDDKGKEKFEKRDN